MGKIVGVVIFISFICVFVFAIYSMVEMQSRTKMANTKLGKEYIVGKDTLIITSYENQSDLFFLSNGAIVSGKLIMANE